MARIAGMAGSGTVGQALSGLTSWELDYEGTALDSTGMDDDGVSQFTQGRTQWSGSASGFWETGGAPASTDVGSGNAEPISLDMVTASGRIYSGNAVITRYHVESSVDGAIEFTLDFQGTGALTDGAT